ncbi:hypothetical protein BD311DRAFT_188132 [Dichomitus squalens]|uniref:Uncharacterized protein n=1 Tax=Dichomitus squalens TaxID=114155 RepID=A0A4Q9MS77_9APHY|nr:hypothetical protein BD311DRAFT_188132 [Dichomitus squalens]
MIRRCIQHKMERNVIWGKSRWGMIMNGWIACTRMFADESRKWYKETRGNGHCEQVFYYMTRRGERWENRAAGQMVTISTWMLQNAANTRGANTSR